MSINDLKVCVVTVCLNCVSVIQETMESIFGQNYSKIEIIVIDGGSTDGTLEYLNSVKSKLNILVSEPDDGIYDAMNKGIIRATGDYLIFMNAGDRFAGDDVLTRVMARTDIVERKPPIISGVVQFEYNREILNYYRSAGQPSGKGGLPHQATFVDVSIHKENLFDSRLRYVGDYEFWRRLKQKNLFSVEVLDVVVAFFTIGGASNNIKFDTKRYLERAYVDSVYERDFNFLTLIKIVLKIPVRFIIDKFFGEKNMFILLQKIKHLRGSRKFHDD